jgi:hypothetical protein
MNSARWLIFLFAFVLLLSSFASAEIIGNWIDLSDTDPDNWVGSNNILSIDYDSNNNIIYTGGFQGHFGYYNSSSNLWIDLRGTAPGSWPSNARIDSVLVDTNNNIAWTINVARNIGRYNLTSNVWEFIFHIPSGDCLNPERSSIDKTNQIIWISCSQGTGFGYYNISSNTFTNVFNRDTSSFFKETPGFSLFNTEMVSFDENNNLVWIGTGNFDEGNFGYYNISSNTMTSIQSITVRRVIYDTLKNIVYYSHGENISYYNISSQQSIIVSNTSVGFFRYATPINDEKSWLSFNNGKLAIHYTNNNSLSFIAKPDPDWVGVNSLNSIFYNSSSDIIWFGANGGKLGYFDINFHINFSAFSKVTNAEVTPFNITIGAVTQDNSIPFPLSAGTYNATFSKEGWYNKIEEIVVIPGTDSYNFTDVADSNVTFFANDGILGTPVTNFTVQILSSENNFSENVTATGTNISTFLLKDIVYNITYFKTGYLPHSVLLNVTNASQNLTVTFFSDATLFIRFLDEVTLTPKQNVTFDILSDAFSGRFNTTTSEFTLQNVPYTDYEIRYSLLDDEYRPRSYFFRIPLQEPALANLTLLVIQENISSLFVRRFVDQAARPLENAIVEIQRAYVSQDNTTIIFRTVEIAEVNTQGNAVFSAIPNTQAYRFRVLVNFSLVKTFPSTFLIAPIEEVRVDLDVSVIENFKKYRDITSALSFNNATNFTILDYSDASGGLDEVCLYLERRYRNIVNRTSQCETATSGTIALATNTAEPGVYYAYATARVGGDIFSLNADYINQDMNVSNLFRYLGPMIYVILIIIAGTISFVSPVFGLAVGFAATAALGLGFAGLFVFSQMALGGLLLTAIILLYLIYRQ